MAQLPNASIDLDLSFDTRQMIELPRTSKNDVQLGKLLWLDGDTPRSFDVLEGPDEFILAAASKKFLGLCSYLTPNTCIVVVAGTFICSCLDSAYTVGDYIAPLSYMLPANDYPEQAIRSSLHSNAVAVTSSAEYAIGRVVDISTQPRSKVRALLRSPLISF